MKIRIRLLLQMALFYAFQFSFADTSLPLFFNNLYNEHKEKIKKVYGPVVLKQIGKVQKDSPSQSITDTILPIVFYHLLFTSKDAADCTRGGILQIPYFWHWIQPNPRYSLLYVPESKPLCETKPPKGFE